MAVAESVPSSRASARGDGTTPRIAYFSAEWCAGPQIALGGSDYWRLALPASKLYEEGWDVIFARNLAESRDDGRICVQNTTGEWLDDRDVIVIQRWMGEGTAEKILRARELGQVIINEVDDDYWNFPEGHAAIAASDPDHNPSANREHYRKSIAASSLVTVSTPQLARDMDSWGPPIKLIRNYVDSKWWVPTPPGDFAGWVGGLPWRGKDLEILRETVVPWLRERRRFFYHGGALPGVRIEDRIGYERVTTRPLASLPEYPKLWEPLRVVLIPIEDTPFGRAKSWCKALEACARRIPFVYSPHSETELLGVGLCAREPEDWPRWLEALEDPDFYAEQAAANRARAEELDISCNWHQWAEVFQGAATSR